MTARRYLHPKDELLDRVAGSNTGRELDTLAHTIREIYMVERRFRDQDPGFGIDPIPHWDGGTTALGVKKKPIWRALAGFFLANQFDVVNFMRAQFDANPRKRPSPTTFMSEASVERYLNYVQRLPAATAAELHSNLEAMKTALVHAESFTRLTRVQRVISVLTSSALTFSPLFRYCMAAQFKLPQVMQLYYRPALSQYAFGRKVYDEMWHGIIPQELKNNVGAMTDMLGGGR